MENQVTRVSAGMVGAFLIKGERYILVDTGMRQSFGKIKKFLEENEIKPKDISLIILTHCHSDHAGSVNQMKELTGAKVLIHKTEAHYLERGNFTPVRARIFLARVITKFMVQPKQPGLKPDLILNDCMSLRKYGVKGAVFHTPGHTPGSISVLLDNGEAVVGDIVTGLINKQQVVSAKYPFIWTDKDELKKSLKMLLDKGAKTFYNAHGAVCDDVSVRTLLEKD